jgi:hypothetical protein
MKKQTRVRANEKDDQLRIATQQRRVQRARKSLKRGTSLVDELLAERREAARNERE